MSRLPVATGRRAVNAARLGWYSGGVMKHRESKPHPMVESGLTRRRRWVPLCGMAGTRAPRPPADGRAAGKSVPGSLRQRGRPADSQLEWVIVGGGIHGTYLSHFLTERLGVDPEALRVLDPHDRPLASWLRNTENVGMTYLRSAAVHHIDLPSLSLKRYAAGHPLGDAAGGRPPFIPPYGRPLLALFNAHAAQILERYGLDRMRVEGRAQELRPAGGGYEVDYASSKGKNTIACRNLLLAIGMDDATCWPPWAKELKGKDMRVYHVLDSDFQRGDLAPWRKAIVYGGGLSGAQLAVALAKRRPGTVTLISGHEMEVHLFDSEPSWQGGNFMASFAGEGDPVKRRAIIARERHRGSLTPEAHAELERLRVEGIVREVTVDRSSLAAEGLDESSFRISSGVESFDADLLVLATGYDTARPGGTWIDRAVEAMELRCAPCGYPIVSPDLEWRRGLFVAGPLAELELGPVARNISGAHRAAARLEYYLSRVPRRAS